MSTLADSFLKDLESGGEEPSSAEEQEPLESSLPAPATPPPIEEPGLGEDAAFAELVEQLTSTPAAVEEGTPANAEAVDRLQKINECLLRVDTEILRLFQMCKEIYGRRFPELEAMLPAPLDYLFVMRNLGNTLSQVNDVKLNAQLSNSAVLAICVAASVSVGAPVTEQDLEKVMAAADTVDRLVELRCKLIDRIEKAMIVAAPNLTAVVGFSLAARLVAHAGGLRELATMPSQNILVVGGSSYARRTAAVTASGGVAATALPQIAANAGKGYGVIYESDLVQTTLPAFRSRALRLVVGKTALAVRKDVFANDGSNTVGKQLRELIVSKLKKAQAPPPARLKKPLPIPEERPRARRGGRRKRRWKEKYGDSQTQKKANRLNVTIDTAAEPDHLQDEDDDDDDVV